VPLLRRVRVCGFVWVRVRVRVCVCVCVCVSVFAGVYCGDGDHICYARERSCMLPRCGCAFVCVSAVRAFIALRASPYVHRLLAFFRDLGNNRISGTLPASLSALTALFSLCRPPACARAMHSVCACVCVCVRVCVSVFACVHRMHWPLARRRDLGKNGLSGTLPASLSALTALHDLCAARPRPRDAFCVCLWFTSVCVRVAR
jgi:hypothetical protein